MGQRWLAGVVVVVSMGCASAPIRKADEVALAAADAKVLEGCYDCLIEARTTYARLAVGRARPLLLSKLLEVELLVALREKELAMDAGPSIARAEALVAELPPALEAARYVALVEAVPADDVGTPRSVDTAFRRGQGAYIDRIDRELVWLAAGGLRPEVRQYLSLAIDCMYERRPRRPADPPRPTAHRDVPASAPPLVLYRRAICGQPNVKLLEGVRAAVPAFVETSYFLARVAVARAQQTGGGQARELLAESHARFPTSPSVTYLRANFSQLIGDCREGLRYYDETVALQPLHENAWLGRTVCLTFQKRTDEAIASATDMIALRPYNVEEAYYWRAWNRHFRKELPMAREDIERAKATASNGRIHTLAGVIEHDQDDLGPSEKDLVSAKDASEGNKNCTARWYLGLVEMKRTRWRESAAHFEDAMKCYEGEALDADAALKAIQGNPDLDAEFKARQIAGFEAAKKESWSQQHAAAFNAANHFARGGDPGKARVLVEIAAKDPALAQLVAELRRALDGKQADRRHEPARLLPQ